MLSSRWPCAGRTRWYLLWCHWTSGCTQTIHWKCDAWMQNWRHISPPALWKPFSCLSHRCFEWEERQHALRVDQILGESVTGGWIHDYQMVTFKLSYLLAGNYFFDMINICDSVHTIAQMQIPVFHTQVWYNLNNMPTDIRALATVEIMPI